jgi:hypothetical protein
MWFPSPRIFKPGTIWLQVLSFFFLSVRMATITPATATMGDTIVAIFAPFERPPSSVGLDGEGEVGVVPAGRVNVASEEPDPAGRFTNAVVASMVEVPGGKQVTSIVAPPSKA